MKRGPETPKKRRAPGSPRDAARAREALLDAAHRRFSEHGYGGTRMSDVARDAGYSEALVYFHFQSKVELFREVVSRIDAQTRWWSPDEGTPEGFVAEMQEGELRYHRDARWRALDRVWAEALAGDRDLLALIQPQLRQAVEALQGQLGSLGPGSPAQRRQLALLLLAVSYGARVLRRYDPEALTPEEAAGLMRFAAESAVTALASGGEAPVGQLGEG